MSQLLNSGRRVSSLFLEIAIHSDNIYKVKKWKSIIYRLEEEIKLSECKKELGVDRIEMCKNILKKLRPNSETNF